ncbi:iron chaperone [Herbiconiux solani]|uniref:iron chaperone n=1 Tax=Herbiconiux solani TaxID=661329 RepID=UPI000825E446|nr:DUF1801 domain-containing protein [Herbiconiux solani]
MATKDTTEEGFSAEERAAMKERAAELRAAKRKAGGKGKDAEAEVLAKIAELEQPDRGIAERLHALILEAAPDLTPKTWYGMPGYAKDGKVLVFFQSSAKFKTRYSTLGFNDSARLDDGDLWPTAYAVADLTPAVEKTVSALIAKAAAAQGGA